MKLVTHSGWGLWAWSATGWWLLLGPVKVGLRDHRTHPAFFSERHGCDRRRRYFHMGHYCLVLARAGQR